MRDPIAKLSKCFVFGTLLMVPSSLVFSGCGGGGGSPSIPSGTVFNLSLKQSSDSNYGDTFKLARSGDITTSDSGNVLTISAYRGEGTIGSPEAYLQDFQIDITHTSAFGRGDVFTVGGTGDFVTGYSRRARTMADARWNATSGRIKVLSRSGSTLSLQVDDLVLTGSTFLAKGTVTFNGTLRVPLRD